MKKTTKKIVYITGASDGLGLDLAKSLLESKDEYTVALISKTRKKILPLAAKYNCLWGVCDVSSWNSVNTVINKLIKKTGRVDCMVHCAGSYATGNLEDLSPQVISKIFKTITLGTIYITKALIPHMKKEGDRQIVLINSIVGFKLTARPGNWLYPLSKAAAMDFTNVISSELAPKGINVSGVYPGAMKTNFYKKGTGKSKDSSAELPTSVVVKGIRFIIDNPDIRINALSLTHLTDYQKSQ